MMTDKEIDDLALRLGCQVEQGVREHVAKVVQREADSLAEWVRFRMRDAITEGISHWIAARSSGNCDDCRQALDQGDARTITCCGECWHEFYRLHEEVRAARQSGLDVHRVLELMDQFEIRDLDSLKHRLEDWERWRFEKVGGEKPKRCFRCGHDLPPKTDQVMTAEYRGRRFTVLVPAPKCSHCGCVRMSGDVLMDYDRIVEDAYRRLYPEAPPHE